MRELVSNATTAGMKALSFAAKHSWNFASGHPIATTCIGAGAITIVAPAIVVGPGLALAGFGSNGIVAGSAAATAQSTIGSVSSGSLFAALQSAGAGGKAASAVYGAVQGTGVSSVLGGAYKAWRDSKVKSKL
jgi:hypothetical protein